MLVICYYTAWYSLSSVLRGINFLGSCKFVSRNGRLVYDMLVDAMTFSFTDDCQQPGLLEQLQMKRKAVVIKMYTLTYVAVKIQI